MCQAEEPPLTEEVEAPSAELPKSPSVAVEAPSPGPHLETVFRTEVFLFSDAFSDAFLMHFLMHFVKHFLERNS